MNERVTKRRRQNRLKRLCFKALKRASKGRLIRKNLVFAAMNSWSQTTSRKLYYIWRNKYLNKISRR